MAKSLNKQAIEMYRDGATNKKIRFALGIKGAELKEILRWHKENARTRALDLYDRESSHEDIKERICRDLCVRMIDLDEWLSFRNFQKKAKKMRLQENEKPKLRVQDGFSHWVSYIVEKCYLEHLWRDRK